MARVTVLMTMIPAPTSWDKEGCQEGWRRRWGTTLMLCSWGSSPCPDTR